MTSDLLKYHVCTFHKCGSTWFRNIFRKLAEQLQISYLPQTTSPGRLNEPLEFGGGKAFMIYPSYTRVGVKTHLTGEERIVLCVRDPRDALVSQYWSWRESHANNNSRILGMREEFKTISEREGIARLIERNYFSFGEEILKWSRKDLQQPNLKIARYESLKADFTSEVSSVLTFLAIDHSPVDLPALEKKASFQSTTERAPGVEDVRAHLRKGIVGDSANYFDDELNKLFAVRYGEVMERLSYPL